MTKHFFTQFLETYAKGRDLFTEIESIGFNLSYENKRFPLESISDEMFDIAMAAMYTDNGIDLVSWFVFECEMGKKCNDSPIDSIGALYDAIIPYKKDLKIN